MQLLHTPNVAVHRLYTVFPIKSLLKQMYSSGGFRSCEIMILSSLFIFVSFIRIGAILVGVLYFRNTFPYSHGLTFFYVQINLPLFTPVYSVYVLLFPLLIFNRVCQPFLPMILVSSANILHGDFICSGRSFLKIANNSGPSTDPFCTPLETGAQFDTESPITTLCLRSFKKDLTQFSRLPSIVRQFGDQVLVVYLVECFCEVQENNFLKVIFSSSILVIVSMNSKMFVVQDLCGIKMRCAFSD